MSFRLKRDTLSRPIKYVELAKSLVELAGQPEQGHPAESDLPGVGL